MNLVAKLMNRKAAVARLEAVTRRPVPQLLVVTEELDLRVEFPRVVRSTSPSGLAE